MEKLKRRLAAALSWLTSKDIKVEHGQIELVDEPEVERLWYQTRHRVTLAVMAILLVMIGGWALAGVYLPKVRLGDVLVPTHQSDTALQSLIQQQAAACKLTITYPDGSKKSFSLADAGMQIDSGSSLADIRSNQRRLANRLQWWRPLTAYLTVSTDDNQLNSFIAEHATVTIQPAQDAALTLKNGSVQLKDSVAGKHYGLDGPVATLTAAASKLQSEPLPLRTLSTRPAISSRQLAASQARIQSILKQDVSFAIDGKNIRASAADIADWVELTSKDSGRSVDVSVNSGKVLAYINNISAAFIHPPKAQVEVVRTGGTPTVLVSGVNGTDITDKSDAAAKVAEDLLEGKGVRQKLSVRYAPYKTITAQAYDKWIEVDLANKRMYAYEQSMLVKTFLVTAGAPRTPTVTGQYAIYSKFAQQDMRGRNVDGSSYYQPKVPWVSYFYKDYAIHGNYWRPLSYFGNINSSHGCVSTVPNEAQWVYSWAPVGTPVIIHS